MADRFVRTDMLPAKAPPIRHTGPAKWLHENLFSSPVNIALTLIGVIVVVWSVWTALPWWWNSVWSADSLRECREAVAAKGATSGACWAVIRHWWKVYIFGFYPADAYWRAILTLGLLMTALAPLLFWNDRKGAILTAIAGVLAVLFMLAMSTAALPLIVSALVFAGLYAVARFRPKLLIWATLAYPFAALFLLWGGQVWIYLSAILAVAVGVGFGLLYGKLRDGMGTVLYATAIAIGAAFVAASLFHYLDAVSADFLVKLSSVRSFYPGWGEDAGLVGRSLGAVASGLIWLVSMGVWAMVGVMRAISWTLNLNLGMLIEVSEAPTSTLGKLLVIIPGIIGVGALLAAFGIFRAARSRTAGLGIIGGPLAIGAYAIFVHPWLTTNLGQAMPLGLSSVRSSDFGGFLLAIIIGVSAISASLPLGILLALGRRSDMWLVKILSVGFIEFIRGVPLITLLFTASLLLAYFLPPGTNFDLILRVIILASLFSAAYIAEVVRGGLAALPRGQYEAADALGLDYWQAQRLIIMPQALKISIPGIVSTFIGLFKDTTLVSFVGLLDPLRGVTMVVRADIAWKGIYWEPYIFVGVIFFLICFGMSRYSMYLERKLKTDHR